MTPGLAIRPSEIKAPYLLFVGDVSDVGYAKTAAGLRDWAPDRCAGQMRLPGGVDLGLSDLTIAEAVGLGVGTLVVGTAADGGRLPPSWRPTLLEALRGGLDLAAGLHIRMAADPELAATAAACNRLIHDVRVPPMGMPVGTGRKRTGLRLLTVGTDCAIGKKYAALSIARSLRAMKVPCTFRATGQTGILIAGSGIPIDAVVSDFVAGAAERLSPDAAADHWDVIEGQGALGHPSYAGVTTGLVHGSQPDALVLCHQPGRTEIIGCAGFVIPPLQDVMAHYLATARLTNRAARFVAIALDTSRLDPQDAERWIRHTEEEQGLTTFDPMRSGVENVTKRLAPWQHS